MPSTAPIGFEKELTALINRYSKENESDTPDWILAEYMLLSLDAFNRTVCKRDGWHDFKPFDKTTHTTP